MTGIEMIKMRQNAVSPDQPKKADAEPARDFLQIMKDRQQAVDEQGAEQPKAAGDEKDQDNTGTPEKETVQKAPDPAGTVQIQAQAQIQAQVFSVLQEQMADPVIAAEQPVAETGGEVQPVVSGAEILSEEMLQEQMLQEDMLQEEETGREPAAAQMKAFQEPMITQKTPETAGEAMAEDNTDVHMAEKPVQTTPASGKTLKHTEENTARNITESPIKPQTEDGKTVQKLVQPEAGPETGASEANTLFQETEDGMDQEVDTEQHVDNRISQLQNQPPGERVHTAEKSHAPVKTSQAHLPADLGKAIADRMPAKDGTLTIELEPASLGKVTIHVVYESGRASLSLMASDPKTLEILSRNAGEIAGILENKTGQETMIYTYESQQEFADSQEEGGRDRGESKEQKEDRREEQPDTFLQQLRLGLV